MKYFIAISYIAVFSTVHAEVRPASIFTDHMVLQRDKAVPVWGKAASGEAVIVEMVGQKKITKADANGDWMVKLDPMPANSVPQSLIVGQVSIQDVLIGEVWLASGQSNMEWEMQMKPDSKEDIPNSTHPNLRLLKVPKSTALTPQVNIALKWTRSSPSTTAAFSAVGYYFGLRLHQELKVPVGIIQSAWGGTRIEPWTSLEGFESVPELKSFSADLFSKLPGTTPYRMAHEEHLSSLDQWKQAVTVALDKKLTVPTMPKQPASLSSDAGTPTALYNAMIHPLVPFAIRGAIWYQGEANRNEGFLYTDKKKALLASWRSAFQQSELPFYFVQIAPCQYKTEDPEILPQFWQAQRKCLDIPHVGMAVISDIGEVSDIHPANKKEVARRLSLWALSKTYNQREINPNGPLYASHIIEGAAIRVKFNHATGGLASRDGKPLTHFEIAELGGDFNVAEARIEGDSVVLTSANVTSPHRARFAWSKIAIANLMNSVGLPATAFHTHWPLDTTLGDNFAKGCTWSSSDKNPYGWDSGLTDGSWASLNPNCYATNNTNQFPKFVTIDLKHPQKLNLIILGTPEIGSTKTIAISVSTDSQKFLDVGKHTFPLAKATRAFIHFQATEVRYIQLAYIDYYPQTAGNYPNTFAFTSEVEAYLMK